MVTGATGYIGNQVVQRLLADGWSVRVLARDPARLDPAWRGRIDVVVGDAGDRDTVRRALSGVDVAWYLLHSMGAGDAFAERDRALAETFADAARSSSLRRIVYLGGLHPDHGLSDHLRSRVLVGEILLGSGIPCAVLQAGIVIGDGSASFTMLRQLSERLPAAIGPAWLHNRVTPIAIDDVVHYLVAAADLPADVNRTFDVGGPDTLTYAELLSEYAETIGLRRRVVVTAPVTTPRTAARWVGLVTSVPSGLADPLVASLLNDTVVKERDLEAIVGPPAGGRTGLRAAIRRATAAVDTGRWRRTLAATTAAVIATAALGSVATDPGSRWYAALDKPAWTPPSWVFPIAWSALYADIAAVEALVLAQSAEAGENRVWRGDVAAMTANLLLNAGWSAVFFRARRLGPASIGAGLLAASSADLVRRAGRQSREKAVVLSPYAAWTAFATALTTQIWRRNRRRR